MIDEGLAHEGLYQAEEAQFVSGNKSYNFKPNNTLSTHYTPALRNHEIFSYGSRVQRFKTSAEFSLVLCSTSFQGQY